VRTKTHSVIVIAQMIARTQLRASSSANWLWHRGAGYRQVRASDTKRIGEGIKGTIVIRDLAKICRLADMPDL
jgi:hypothetical protein